MKLNEKLKVTNTLTNVTIHHGVDRLGIATSILSNIVLVKLPLPQDLIVFVQFVDSLNLGEGKWQRGQYGGLGVEDYRAVWPDGSRLKVALP